MTVTYMEPLVMIVLGGILAYLNAKKFRPRHPDAYFHISMALILLFWIKAFLIAVGVIENGALHWFSVDVHWAVGLFHVLAFPLWFLWGSERVYFHVGRNPQQAGALWPFQMEDKSLPFEPMWKSYEGRD
ncbi:hypothetical protein ACFL4G_00410 [Thermodesulfobacteriota bacterium]